MNKIIDVLTNKFIIKQVIIENFTVLDKEIKLIINIFSQKHGDLNIFFENVTDLNISSVNYTCSEKSSIIFEDISSNQIENKNFKIILSDDALTFYSKSISLIDVN